MTKGQRPNQFYDLIDPKTGRIYKANPDRVWGYIKESMDKLLRDNKVVFPTDTTKRPMLKRFRSELKSDVNPFSSWLDDVGMNAESTKEIRDIFNATIFNYSKPLSLINALISQTTANNDIVLDFFGGSGTTAQAVLELNREDGGNRKFILVQIPEPCQENSEAFKAKYKTIADIAKERIRRFIHKIEKEKAEKPDLFDEGKSDLGFKVFKMSHSNFKIWRGGEIDNEEKLMQQMDAFTNPTRPGSEKQNMLYELMLKAGYELTSPVQYVTLSGAKGSEDVGYYSINNNDLIIALDAINKKLIEQIVAAKPQKVITLDNLFTGNDQLKTNTVLQMRDAGVDFKTI